MDKKSKFLSKKSLVLMAISLLIFVFFFENIKGQYRFMQYCNREGGLHIYEPLKKGAGWIAKDYDSARMVAILEHVGFVRFFDKDGKEYDLRYVGNNPQRDESFNKEIKDLTKYPVYLWANDSKRIDGELRLSRRSYEVFSIEDNELLVSYYSFGYSQFERKNTLLMAPSGVSCFYEPAKSIGEISGWRQSINESFEN